MEIGGCLLNVDEIEVFRGNRNLLANAWHTNCAAQERLIFTIWKSRRNAPGQEGLNLVRDK